MEPYALYATADSSQRERAFARDFSKLAHQDLRELDINGWVLGSLGCMGWEYHLYCSSPPTI